MKQWISIVIALVCFPVSALCQKDYISPVFSYSLGLGKSDIRISNDETFLGQDTVTYSYTYKNQGFSLGQGYHLGLSYGHNFGTYIGFEIIAEYYKASPRTVELTSYIQYVLYPTFDCKIKQDEKYMLKSVNLSPTIHMSPGWLKWNPYLKCGVDVSYIFLEEQKDIKITDYLPGYIPYEHYYYLYKYNPVFTVGVFGALGFEFLSDRLFNPYLEAEFAYLIYRPKKSKIVKYTYQDNDVLETLHENERNIEYVDSYSDSDHDINKPGKELAFSIPMNRISIKAGVRIKLSNRVRK